MSSDIPEPAADEIATTPTPPYTAVIFTSLRTGGDHGYTAMANQMAELATQQPGYLGIESAGEEVEITASYWQTEDNARDWKQGVPHAEAQRLGREVLALRHSGRDGHARVRKLMLRRIDPPYLGEMTEPATLRLMAICGSLQKESSNPCCPPLRKWCGPASNLRCTTASAADALQLVLGTLVEAARPHLRSRRDE